MCTLEPKLSSTGAKCFCWFIQVYLERNAASAISVLLIDQGVGMIEHLVALVHLLVTEGKINSYL